MAGGGVAGDTASDTTNNGLLDLNGPLRIFKHVYGALGSTLLSTYGTSYLLCT